MIKGDYLSTILISTKSVFTLKDIAILWHESNYDIIKNRINYYVSSGDLYKIRRGYYAKTKAYRKLELAGRIFTPSYISFETILAREGLIFQYQSAITAAAYLTRSLNIEHQSYVYKKIKNPVLIDPAGMRYEDETALAGKERAFLDTLYLNAEYHFDNLRSIDWDRVFEILPVYQNMRLSKTVEAIFRQFKATG
jgi:hypothetical protein